MINAYSLAAEVLYGDMDKTYPIINQSEMKLRDKTMKLSEKTLTLLKNFSNINQSILFKQGSSLRTISVMKNILAEATIDEDLPADFGIYDLGQFLNGLALHQRPELDFQNDGFVYIKEGRMRSKYFFADPKVIVTPPEKEITLPSEDVSFTLSTDQLDKLLKAAGIYQLPDLAVVGKNGVVKILVRDKKNDTSNDFAITVGETDESFEFNFKVENIKILPGTYDVVVSKKLLSRFTCQNYNLKYYIALEPDSTFE
jgi:hypothetical protein|tara:strand:+ start:241 stop:1008 length:768 start_codon:yes stop_codon:yes gene_type:complete